MIAIEGMAGFYSDEESVSRDTSSFPRKREPRFLT
jgi:hypothetical protein